MVGNRMTGDGVGDRDWDKYGVVRKGRGWFGTVLVVQE